MHLEPLRIKGAKIGYVHLEPLRIKGPKIGHMHLEPLRIKGAKIGYIHIDPLRNKGVNNRTHTLRDIIFNVIFFYIFGFFIIFL